MPQAVFSDESENFRKPAEPSAEDFVEISILTGRNNASAVCLCVDDKRLLMERVENGRVLRSLPCCLAADRRSGKLLFPDHI